MFCINCGYRNVDTAKFCRRCGSPLYSEDEWTPAEEAGHDDPEEMLVGGLSYDGVRSGRNAGSDIRQQENKRRRRPYEDRNTDIIPGNRTVNQDRDTSQERQSRSTAGESRADMQRGRSASGESRADMQRSRKTPEGAQTGTQRQAPGQQVQASGRNNDTGFGRNNDYGRDNDKSLPLIIAATVILALTVAAGLMVFRLVSRNIRISDGGSGRSAVSGRQQTSEGNTSVSDNSGQTGNSDEGSEEASSDAPVIEYLDDHSKTESEGAGGSGTSGSATEGAGGSGTSGSAAEGAGGSDASGSAAEVADGPGTSGSTAEGASGSETSGSTAEGTSGSGALVSMESVGQAADNSFSMENVTASVLPLNMDPDLSGYTLASVSGTNASSSIMQENIDNSPAVLFDGREETSWQEGTDGYGIGEWISWEPDPAFRVRYIGFKMGNWADDSRYYYGNATPKSVELQIEGKSFELEFSSDRVVQWVEFSSEIPARSMRLVIKDVYPGIEWRDTCISEIMVYGKNAG
ncbi:MAG: zinc-ribbon domain-containing protein [Blautia sp.]|nr:zinc-ribbon domain-containing protein [Blautia sp.]